MEAIAPQHIPFYIIMIYIVFALHQSIPCSRLIRVCFFFALAECCAVKAKAQAHPKRSIQLKAHEHNPNECERRNKKSHQQQNKIIAI